MPEYEWGVQHSQGIRMVGSEKAALEDLEWLTKAWLTNPRNKVQPLIVRREVSPWVPVHQSHRQELVQRLRDGGSDG